MDLFNTIILNVTTAVLSTAISSVITFFLTRNFYIGKFFQKELTLLRNLKRETYYFELGTGLGGFDVLAQNRLFEGKIKKKNSVTALSIPNANLGLVVIEYSKMREDEVDAIFNKAAQKNLPIILYAKENIEDRNKYLGNDANADIVNSPLRLVSIIFSILSSFDHDR